MAVMMIANLHQFYRENLKHTFLGPIVRFTVNTLSDPGYPYRALCQGMSRRQHALHLFFHRLRYVSRYQKRKFRLAVTWLFTSRETENFTYDITQQNRRYLAEILAVAFDRPTAEIEGYIAEADHDQDLRATIRTTTQRYDHLNADDTALFGRRLGWYAAVRALKPKVLVETGIDKGLGSVLLCAALLRNRAEGYPGYYYGTDINPAAGYLLQPPYAETGKVLYGDSLESLAALDKHIDLFINDSDHSAAYEAREYDLIADKLSPNAVILGDNAHLTTALADFSRRHGRHFLFFREEPVGHWYAGAGIGISYPKR
jgi:predicted O-methyltransferase YrrM